MVTGIYCTPERVRGRGDGEGWKKGGVREQET